MNPIQVKTILKLFKSYVDNSMNNELTFNMQRGIVLEGVPSPIVTGFAEELYGKNGKELNQTLHKSFSTVSESTINKLISDQILHYFSTYGLESLNIRPDGFVYIPHEQLEIPELKEDVKLVLIKRITEKDLQTRIMDLLTTNIALSQELIEDLKELSDYIPKDCIEKINNREFRTYLFDKYDLVPFNPNNFMKYLLYKVTGSTLFIFNEYKFNKNIKHYTKLKQVNQGLLDMTYGEDVYNLFKKYINSYPNLAYTNLAGVFNRYKTVFLTFKKFDKRYKYNKELTTIINRISKKSKKMHQPIKLSLLDKILRTDFTDAQLLEKLDKISIFKELRLLDYINTIMNIKDYESFVKLYRIRNRKVFAKILDEKYFKTLCDNACQGRIYTLIYNHLNKRIGNNFKDKTFYIPKNFDIAIPTSEKKFIENIPEKSFIVVPRNKNLVIGIHWFNLPNSRVDLDLHMTNKTSQFGWSSSYRSNDRQILYSGDMTDAPKPYGASEYFLIRSNTELDTYLLTLNNYMKTYKDRKMPFEFIIAETDESEISRNYVVDPNSILIKMNRNMFEENGYQTCLGLLEINEYDIKFYFTNFDMNNTGTVTKNDDITKMIYDGFKLDLTNTLYLNNLLLTFGAKQCNEPFTEAFKEIKVNDKIYYEKIKTNVDIDLSPESLSKETIINLFKEENK